MAASILDGIIQTVVAKLESLIVEEVESLLYVEKEVKNLKDSLFLIKERLLLDVEKQKTERLLLEQLKDVLYDADDLLDGFQTEAVLRQRAMTKEEVSRFFPFLRSKLFGFFFERGSQIRENREELDAILSDLSKFNFKGPQEAEAKAKEKLEEEEADVVFGKSESEIHHLILTSQVIVGRDEEKEKIVQQLLAPAENNVQVIPIVGMGGLGKTTLARLVYNDERVQSHFRDPRIWINISENFHVKKLAQRIIESVTDYECNISSMQLLQTKLQESLGGKKYLLVLDDVWDTNQDKWDVLKDLIVDGAKGSKIIVTTRSKKVASIMGTVSPLDLTYLNEDDSCYLFKIRAFDQGAAEKHPDLVNIGKVIVKKCYGVPLALQFLGSLLRLKRKQSEWLNVLESEIWNLSEEETGILCPLKLSYDYLPYYLKQCFMYCSLFPKDHVFHREKLIQLWMAQGFIIQPSERSVSLQLEAIGNRYFEELLWRSFFQDVAKDEDGSIKTFKMHDLVHDLAKFVARSECSMIDTYSQSSKNIMEKGRHLSVTDYSSNFIISVPILKAKKLRTLLLQSPHEVNIDKVSRFRCLRVLDLSDTGIEKLPSSIGELNHLRYLDISQNNRIRRLPNSLTKLQNLQTLKLSHCGGLQQLPEGIGNMINLRHIESGYNYWTHMPCGLEQLCFLQTLPFFVLGRGIGCRLRELHSLKHLRGELRIANLGDMRNTLDAREANLKEKQDLRFLELEWYTWGDRKNIAEEFHVLEGLQPPPNLKVLIIRGYWGVNFPHWTMNMGQFLPNLKQISLLDCKSCENLPSLGQLPALEVLNLLNMDAIRHINGNEISFGSSLFREGRVAFPSLKQLSLQSMLKLKEWSRLVVVDKGKGRTATTAAGAAEERLEEEEHLLLSFPSLVKLIIRGCPMLTTIPFHPSLEELELFDCSERLLHSMMTMTADEYIETSNTPLVSPFSLLGNLKSLVIERCANLASLPEEGFKNLTSLKSLEIRNCSSFSVRYLTALEVLEFCNCPDYHLLEGIQSLTTLRTLKIDGFQQLVSLPEELQYTTSLESLSIKNCSSLISLPEGLGNMKFLQKLDISGCCNLSSLPGGMQCLINLHELRIFECPNLSSLPEGIQHLNALQHLSISWCPNLSRRCQREIGKDWPKISHIPFIGIDTKMI